MKFAIMGVVLAATVMNALPASAEVVIRAGEGGVAVGERHHDRGWRRLGRGATAPHRMRGDPHAHRDAERPGHHQDPP